MAPLRIPKMKINLTDQVSKDMTDESQDMDKIFVIAGNPHQYKNYLFKNKLNPNKYIYISTVEKMFGTANPKVIKVGTYWENPILDRVEKEVLLRNGSFENEKR